MSSDVAEDIQESAASVALEPPIADDSGYCITHADLKLLDLAANDVSAFRKRRYPLGMTRETYAHFRQGLFGALTADGISDADVRLKGSAATFFSGPHKQMPTDARDVIAEFKRTYGRRPHPEQLSLILRSMEDAWPVGHARPLRRPFNSLYKLRIHRNSSDYDLQIASDQIYSRCKAWVDERGWGDVISLEHPTYAFVDKEVFAEVCQHIEDWRVTAAEFLRYPITVAAFPAAGPPDFSKSLSKKKRSLSSHHRETDWKIRAYDDPAMLSADR